jgi:hypothetical protein
MENKGSCMMEECGSMLEEHYLMLVASIFACHIVCNTLWEAHVLPFNVQWYIKKVGENALIS